MSISESRNAGWRATDFGAPTYRDRLGRGLASTSMVLALLGVAIIGLLACMLCVTIVARKLLGWQVTGDHELVQVFAAVSLSMLFPWCHLTGGNVIVDLLTSSLPRRANILLDRTGSLLLGLVALLLAWRTGVLVEQTWSRGSFTPLLAWPLWLPQLFMLPGLLLTSVVGCYLALAPRALEVRDLDAEHGA